MPRYLLFTLFAVTALLFSCQPSVKMDLTLNPLFSDHMVLQQQEAVNFWGIYNPNEKVSIEGSWGQTTSVQTDENGNWKTQLQTPEAGGPFEVSITTADSTIQLKDVMIGEVWLASGQSNMEMSLLGYLPNEPIDNNTEEIANANYPDIRFITVSRATSPLAEDSFSGEWKPTSPQTADTFSASAYFFARKVHQELGIPVGIIHSSWGGTPVEAWMSKEKILNLGEFEEALENLNAEKIDIFNAWFDKFPTATLPSGAETWENLNLQDDNFQTDDFDDASWATANLPGLFEEITKSEVNGAIWFRKKINIEDLSSDYTLHIEEGIDDMDVTYINGQKVGFTLCWNCPRAYTISKSILKEGENLIAIRAIDTGGPGRVSGKMYLQNESGVEIPIDGEWRFQHIADFRMGKLLLYHANPEAYQNPPEGIESFSLTANTPSVLFNGMINPLIPFNLQGAIWYQGESNVGRAAQYEKLFPGMIEDWRERWADDLSFYFVQIAPFGYGNELSPALRDAQRKSLKTEKTGMAITMDIGDLKSIHPGNKQDVGDRLARLALVNDYGKNMVASGPLYKEAYITMGSNKILVDFDHKGSGLVTPYKGLHGFEIAGEDKKFVPAFASIVNDRVEVSADEISEPKYVRYAWKDFINGSLFNKEGLPASSFTSE